jgi:hypothetical protein
MVNLTTYQNELAKKVDQAQGVVDALCQAPDLREITREQLTHLLSDLLNQIETLIDGQGVPT